MLAVLVPECTCIICQIKSSVKFWLCKNGVTITESDKTAVLLKNMVE